MQEVVTVGLGTAKWRRRKNGCIVRCERLGLEWGIGGMFEEGEWLGGK
jgi:hypothetical protein